MNDESLDTLLDEIRACEEDKAEIQQALIDRGVDAYGHGLSSFADDIRQIKGGGEIYEGEYNVIPDFYTQVLQTKNKTMADNVSVSSIPVYYVTNPTGGITVTIGEIK